MLNASMRSFLVISTVSLIAGCSPVQFSSTNGSNKGGGGNNGGNNGQNVNISCTLSMDSGVTSKTVTTAAQNPVVKAQCTPAAVTHSWSVTRSGSSVTINGLTGSSSTADFFAAGNGTYLINLTATKSGFTTYTSTTPLTVTVNTGSTPPTTPNISCSPKLNGSSAPITLTQGSANPILTAGCTPSDVSYVWTVTRSGFTHTIPGLSGSSSTPDFSSQVPGTYEISLQASRSGYNSYLLPSPLLVTVQARPTQSVTTTKTVTNTDNQLDILLVIDDSNSMLADNRRLASRLQGFVNDLTNAGFDWQMCATLTRPQQVSSTDPTWYWGASRHWVGNTNSTKYILKPGSGNINQIFVNTIENIGAGWANTDDERGIKAAFWHMWNGDPAYAGASGCYRANAGLSVIIISDEDVRSIGGDISQRYYSHELKALEADDLPATYNNFVKESFGNQKRFTVNSIIVRPGDTACMAAQDAEGSKSHFGHHYAQLSNLTSGYIGNICASDYSANLRYFKESIITDMASLPLDCEPVGAVNVTVSPTMSFGTRVEGSSLIFDPRIPAGRTITATYNCYQ